MYVKIMKFYQKARYSVFTVKNKTYHQNLNFFKLCYRLKIFYLNPIRNFYTISHINSKIHIIEQRAINNKYTTLPIRTRHLSPNSGSAALLFCKPIRKGKVGRK